MNPLMDQDFIPYGRHAITEDDISSVVDALRSPFLTQGPVVPSLSRLQIKGRCFTE